MPAQPPGLQPYGGLAGPGKTRGALQKKTLKAGEQDRPDVHEKRVAWWKKVKTVDPQRLIFIDESGAKTNMTRLCGRSFDGQRVYDSVPYAHWGTTTMVGAIGWKGVKAPFVLEGAMDAEAFRIYIEKVLVPQLHAGDIVVFDNLSSHKDSAARQKIEEQGAEVWDLPPYSPDFNPIEQLWSKIKSLLRKAKARTQEGLIRAIAEALKTVTQKDCVGWFKHCGYLESIP